MMIDNEIRSLLVVGSVAYDDIDGPFGKHDNILGGSASFFSTAASYLCDQVGVIAVVGDDFDQAHLDGFCSRGIDCSGVKRISGKTFHWSGRYSDDLSSRESLSTELGVFADFQPDLSAKHKETQLLFLGNIHPNLQHDVLDQVKGPEFVAADTMNFWIGGNRDALLKTLARVDSLIINDEEARQLSGHYNLVAAAETIRAMGPQTLVIKRADAGALLFDHAGEFAAPALPLKDVRDPTGAGDSFAGGFMGYLARAGAIDSDAMRSAVIFGSVMASFSVEQFSLAGIEGLSRMDIQNRFDRFCELTRFVQIRL